MSNPVNRIRATQTCRNWNEVFPIGTEVELDGQRVRTWSHAALGPRDEPSVFLEGIQEPVPIAVLTVPGWDRTTKRKNSQPEK